MRAIPQNNMSRRRRRVSSVSGASGFSMAELLIAMAILGVGLTMVAALFPAGMAGTQDSVNQGLGTIICRNGRAIAQAKRWKYNPNNPNDPSNELPTSSTLEVLADSDNTSPISDLEQTYPQEDLNSSLGFLILGRRTGVGQQLVIIAYDKTVDGDITLEDVTVTADDEDFDATSAGVPAATLRGSPVILSSGEYATIIDVGMDKNGNLRAYLDHPLSTSSTTAQVVVEAGASKSPVIGVLVVNTSLQETP